MDFLYFQVRESVHHPRHVLTRWRRVRVEQAQNKDYREQKRSSHGAFMSVSISGIYFVTTFHDNTRTVTEVKLILGQNIYDPAERL